MEPFTMKCGVCGLRLEFRTRADIESCAECADCAAAICAACAEDHDQCNQCEAADARCMPWLKG